MNDTHGNVSLLQMAEHMSFEGVTREQLLEKLRLGRCIILGSGGDSGRSDEEYARWWERLVTDWGYTCTTSKSSEWK